MHMWEREHVHMKKEGTGHFRYFEKLYWGWGTNDIIWKSFVGGFGSISVTFTDNPHDGDSEISPGGVLH